MYFRLVLLFCRLTVNNIDSQWGVLDKQTLTKCCHLFSKFRCKNFYHFLKCFCCLRLIFLNQLLMPYLTFVSDFLISSQVHVRTM